MKAQSKADAPEIIHRGLSAGLVHKKLGCAPINQVLRVYEYFTCLPLAGYFISNLTMRDAFIMALLRAWGKQYASVYYAVV